MKYRIGCLVVLICIVLLFVLQNNYEGFEEEDPCDETLTDLKKAKSSLNGALKSTKDAAGDKVGTLSAEYKDIFNKAIKEDCKIPKSKSSMF